MIRFRIINTILLVLMIISLSSCKNYIDKAAEKAMAGKEKKNLTMYVSDVLLGKNISEAYEKQLRGAYVYRTSPEQTIIESFKSFIGHVYNITDSNNYDLTAVLYVENLKMSEPKWRKSKGKNKQYYSTLNVSMSIRYELKDIIHEKKNCACGQSTLAIEQIEGRSDDVLFFNPSSIALLLYFLSVFLTYESTKAAKTS